MESGNAGLEAIKAKMSETQRKDMAELLANELRSRVAAKKTGTTAAPASNVKSSRLATPLNREQVRDLYKSVNKTLENKKSGGKAAKQESKKEPKLEASPENVRDLVRLSQRGGIRMPSTNAILMIGIAIFGGLKILFSTGLVAAAIEPRAKSDAPAAITSANTSNSTATPESLPAIPAEAPKPTAQPAATSTTPTDRALLTELEARRVELEKRRVELEHRAEELSLQEREMSTRLAELRTLTRQLADHRVEKDQGRESRIEQLANVYGAMAPQEAAPLISKLDESISLDLLQRLPGKRMAQILSAMDQSRAVEITKKLSERVPSGDSAQNPAE